MHETFVKVLAALYTRADDNSWEQRDADDIQVSSICLWHPGHPRTGKPKWKNIRLCFVRCL